MKMNLPNLLTILRVIMIPIFLVILLGGFIEIQLARYIAVGIFIVASVTDFFDGYIARKYKLVTNFGIFMDPMADKLLVCSALVAMIELGDIPAWIVILIVSREFIISGFRLIASDQGLVLAASKWGKIKTATQMMMVIFVLLNFDNAVTSAFGSLLIYLAAFLTVISAVDYIVKNKHVLMDTPKAR